MHELSLDDMRAFGERGYLVLPGVVPRPLIDAALHAVADLMIREPPAERGNHAYWPRVEGHDPLLAPLLESPAFALAESLIRPRTLTVPTSAQVSLHTPPASHRPGAPHIDGLSPTQKSGRPGTFTLLAGIFLTDQPYEDMGNIWVWPETHLRCAAYLRAHGPEALLRMDTSYPPIDMPEGCQVLGRAGDILLAHYLLGHNIGGNGSAQTRKVIYFRLSSAGHEETWKEFVQDALFELAPVRAALGKNTP